MKVFWYLFLCTSLFCISTDAGLSSPWHHPFSHEITARDDIDYRHLASCGAVAAKVLCNNGEFQEAATLALKCNMTQNAEDISSGCQKNRYGTYCALAIYLRPTISENYTAFCMGSNCTQECKNLLTFVRNELGCCASVMLDSTSSSYNLLNPFKYALWHKCSVEMITEECARSTAPS